MNNYEKIKQMTIEEMAEAFTNPNGGVQLYCTTRICPEEFSNENACKNCMKQWLESESEE